MLDNKDIFYLNKNEILDILSKIDDVIFVGGTSEYLQGVKKELNDIDIRITNFENLISIGYIHKFKLDLFYGLSGNRGVIKLINFLLIPLKVLLIHHGSDSVSTFDKCFLKSSKSLQFKKFSFSVDG